MTKEERAELRALLVQIEALVIADDDEDDDDNDEEDEQTEPSAPSESHPDDDAAKLSLQTTDYSSMRNALEQMNQAYAWLIEKSK
jgi:hypothetical protein